MEQKGLLAPAHHAARHPAGNDWASYPAPRRRNCALDAAHLRQPGVRFSSNPERTGSSSTSWIAAFSRWEALAYIRGRQASPSSFIICDEAQNSPPHMIKTLITPRGRGDEIVFTGDPEQIDHPTFDASSNGLTYLVESLKDEEIAGHVTLFKGERSLVAEMGGDSL